MKLVDALTPPLTPYDKDDSGRISMVCHVFCQTAHPILDELFVYFPFEHITYSYIFRSQKLTLISISQQNTIFPSLNITLYRILIYYQTSVKPTPYQM